MKLRSLDKDSQSITFGAALLLLGNDMEKLETSKTHRLDFFDERRHCWFSIEGKQKEIEMLITLFLLVGSAIPLEMLNRIPESFRELRGRKRSKNAWREGIVHMLENLNSIAVPEYWESDVRAFNEWLRQFELKK